MGWLTRVLFSDCLFTDFHLALLDCFQGDSAVLANQLSIDKKTISDRSDGRDIGQIQIGQIEGPRKKITGGRPGNIAVTFQSK